MTTRFSMSIAVAALIVALIAATSVAVAGPRTLEQSAGGAPPVVSYQGKVMVTGVPYTGPGYFKFAFVDAAGTTSYWSNDGSSSAGSEPTASVALTVANGLFTVLLGDTTLTNMQSLGAGVFSETERYLRVWFSSDGSAFTQLAPDQRVASVPYALQAAEALNADTVDGQHADASYYPLLQAQFVDMALADGGLKGFQSGFTDGRYGYFVPSYNGTSVSGKVGRVDLGNFTATGVTWRDLTLVNAGLKGFIGGFSDGRYGYFVPSHNGTSYSGMVARVDLQDFTSGAVTVLDLSSGGDSGLKGFWGGFTDGRYGYFVPNHNDTVYSGKVARVDLQNFAIGGVTTLDLTSGGDAGLKGFRGGFTDGRYGYFVPNSTSGNAYSGKVARVDLQNFAIGGVTTLDLTLVDAGLVGFIGGFTDGRYGYFVPYYNDSGFSGKAARVDLQNFTTTGVTWLDLAAVDSGLKGFMGGFTDGRYGYFVPNANLSGYSGKVARVDLRNFAVGGVTWINLAVYNPGLVGFNGGFSDGRYGYFVPNSSGNYGRVARIPLFYGGGAP